MHKLVEKMFFFSNKIAATTKTSAKPQVNNILCSKDEYKLYAL